jgi:hypothetical protein
MATQARHAKDPAEWPKNAAIKMNYAAPSLACQVVNAIFSRLTGDVKLILSCN